MCFLRFLVLCGLLESWTLFAVLVVTLSLGKELQGSHDPAKVAAENEKKGEEFINKRQYDLACECYTKATFYSW